MSTNIPPEDVFVTDGYPVHSYVPANSGRQELELHEGLEQKNKIISISGPSKSGKTTLCDKVFGPSKGVDLIYVPGGHVQKPEDLWAEAYAQVSDDGDKTFFEQTQSQIIQHLIGKKIPLVIDDFHYIKRDVQQTVSRQIKNAASEGLRIVCLSVPHRGDDPIRSNADLSGRYFSINFEFWSTEDLAQIAQTGLPKVGFPSVDSFNEQLAEEALRSPQIMQTLCLESCRSVGQDRPYEHVDVTQLSIDEIKRRTLRSYNNASALDILLQGPLRHGKKRTTYLTLGGASVDVYELLVETLKTNPAFQQLGLEEIRDRARALLTSGHEPSNITSALQHYEGVFEAANTPAPIDWDNDKRRLTVVDPHFYFYLRNHSLLNR